jgi:hypothetical protein
MVGHLSSCPWPIEWTCVSADPGPVAEVVTFRLFILSFIRPQADEINLLDVPRGNKGKPSTRGRPREKMDLINDSQSGDGETGGFYGNLGQISARIAAEGEAQQEKQRNPCPAHKSPPYAPSLCRIY